MVKKSAIKVGFFLFVKEQCCYKVMFKALIESLMFTNPEYLN